MCIAFRYVYRNKQEAWDHTPVHDCKLILIMEINFLATFKKILKSAPLDKFLDTRLIWIGNKTNQLKPYPLVSRQAGTKRNSFHKKKTTL